MCSVEEIKRVSLSNEFWALSSGEHLNMIDFLLEYIEEKEREAMRKATGIVRGLDNLGRVVIPKELRRAYGIEAGDPIEFYTADGEIILRKYQPGCVFCGESENLEHFRGKHVCGRCKVELVQTSDSSDRDE